ncbi:MAG: stage II sporulation protein M, partial [Ruminococcus sp.]|nr:stage II sporulation protein M [Ruminococcus sp.]
FLLGLAPWGIPFLPFVSAFKGFGTGLTAAYLIITYSLKGAGFYLLVVLPGTFLFCLALVKLSAYAFEISKQMFFSLIGHSHQTNSLKNEVIDFCSQSVSALIMTFCSTLLDTALWCLFSGAFNF